MTKSIRLDKETFVLHLYCESLLPLMYEYHKITDRWEKEL